MKKILFVLGFLAFEAINFWITWWVVYERVRDWLEVKHDFLRFVLAVSLVTLPVISTVVVFAIFWFATSGEISRFFWRQCTSSHSK